MNKKQCLDFDEETQSALQGEPMAAASQPDVEEASQPNEVEASQPNEEEVSQPNETEEVDVAAASQPIVESLNWFACNIACLIFSAAPSPCTTVGISRM